MITAVSTNITSPLGLTSEQNFRSVRNGMSALSQFNSWRGVEGPFCLAAFSDTQWSELRISGYTDFESLVICSVTEALSRVDIDLSSPRTAFLLSTTKANVDELLKEGGNYLSPGETAEKISSFFGFVTKPVVVCNACISGVTALVYAERLISDGIYDNVVVCGADVLSLFTVAGFTAFKAMSPQECRPFDIERTGLNLGEAAATVILAKGCGGWHIQAGSLTNDAYHVSAPSPSGDGLHQAVVNVMQGVDTGELAFVNAHGTATMFNDQMESRALERAGLSSVPVTALKSHFGHTLGAAGILETIVSMMSVDSGVTLPVRGFNECGISGKITLCRSCTPTDRKSFLKMISGFGGCNAALLMSCCAADFAENRKIKDVRPLHTVHIDAISLTVDGKKVDVVEKGKSLLTEIYRKYGDDYPRFYKMDILSRLLFVASGILERECPDGSGRRAVVLFNSSSSVVSDRQYLSTMWNGIEFLPSPSAFLYTLPNVAVGEIAVKQHITGETTLFVLPGRDDKFMADIVSSAFRNSPADSMITGYVDCRSEDDFEADLKLLIET